MLQVGEMELYGSYKKYREANITKQATESFMS